MIQRKIIVSGKVQGVGFRMSVFEAARKFPTLQGYVKNLSDGRVEARFAGKEDEVLSMAAWCKKGPPEARVLTIEIIEEEPNLSLPLFEIQR